jgi:PIN domain nuclease of toxin-antitoxin system
MAGGKPVILDTCALLWLAGGDKKISRSMLKQINESAAVYVSDISGFEIASKVVRGKLTLPLDPMGCCERAIEHHGLTVLPLH